MQNLGTASVAALRQYVRAAESAGIDISALFTQTDLNPHILDSDDGRINGEQFQRFIHLLCELTHNPVLGLETGDFVQPGSYSVLGYITMSCATLGEAVARIAPFEKLVGDMGTTGLSMAQGSITLKQALLETRLRQPDPMLRKTLEAHALTQLASLDTLDTDTDLTSRVKHSIQQQLMHGITRQDMIAEDLGITSRTLQRKLSLEGVSYQQLLDEVRQKIAEDYLLNSDLTIPDIALRLGYSETTSFHRKFKAVTGKTPGKFRGR